MQIVILFAISASRWSFKLEAFQAETRGKLMGRVKVPTSFFFFFFFFLFGECNQ